MKFHTLPLAALGILCSLSSMSYAQKTAEELEIEIMHLACPPGQQAAAVGIMCPRDARDPLDCWRTRVECVKPAFRNDQKQRGTVSENKGITPALKTEQELDYEMQHKKCPFGESPAKTAPFCPTGARDPSDCTPVAVRCVKYSFSNVWNGRPEPKVSASNPQKTEEELNSEVAHMTCPVGQKPMRVFALCPSGAKDDECWRWEADQYAPANIPLWARIVVKCVKTDSSNARGGAEPGVPTSPLSPKTGEELDYVVQHMRCPAGQRPAKILSFCPQGAKDSRDCSLEGVKCVKESISNVWGGKTDPEVTPLRHLKTEEELDYEIQHMQCPIGQRPAKTSSFCPTGAKDPHDCVPGMVRCVKESISNDWKDRTKPKVSTSPAQSPKTEEELIYEMRHMQCPFGERPAKISSFCPPGAKDTNDCASVEVRCVKQSFSNLWGGRPDPEVPTPRPPKTEAELNRELAHKVCPVGQKAMKVFALCPPGAEDDDCWEWATDRYESNLPIESRIVVKCIKYDFGNVRGNAEPSLLTSTSPPKTEKELNSEVASMACPFGQRATKVFAICPLGAKDAECWEWTTDHYESNLPIESRIVVKCIKNDFGNVRGDAEPSLLTSTSSPKTEKELNSEIASMACPFGQKPAKVFAICPLGAKDAECWEWTTDHYESNDPIESRIVVKCIKNHFGKARRDAEPSELTSTSSLKTVFF